MHQADLRNAQSAGSPRYVEGYAGSETGIHAWIMAGGAHHTVLSYAVTAEQMEDWAEIMGIEFVHITKDTTISALKQQLLVSDLAWKLK